MANFRTYRVWTLAHELTLAVYSKTSDFPTEERFGLVRQMRRSAAAIPANIAEGLGKSSDREKARYADIALGSSYELDYHLLLSRDLQYLEDEDYSQLLAIVTSVKKMLHRLRRRLLNS